MDKTGNGSTKRFRNLGFRFMPTLITIILISFAFYFYLTVIVNQNETELKERKFRGLHLVAENIKVKIDRYQDKNVDNFLTTLDSLNKQPAKRRQDADPKKATLLLEAEYGLKKRSAHGLPEVIADKLTKRKKVVNYDAAEKELQFFKAGEKSGAGAVINEFLEPLLRKDVFTNYLLAYNNSIIYDELNHSQDTLSGFLTNSVSADTVIHVPFNPSGQLTTVIIGGKKYRLFTQRFVIDRDESFIVGGYFPEDDYLQESNYVPTYLIVWLIIGVVLAIIMLPLLRIFLLHATEQLVTLTASSAIAAAHVLASVSMLTIIGTFLYFVVFRTADDTRLRTLAEKIETNLHDEVDAGINTIRTVNQLLVDKTDTQDIILQNAPIDLLSGKSSDTSYDILLNRANTPDFSHIIWTDKDGQQKLRWTTDSTVPIKINIKKRDYFQALENDQLFYTAKGDPYFLGAISSWISAKTFAAISLPYYPPVIGTDTSKNLVEETGKYNNKTAGLQSLKAVYMTGQFKSLYVPVIPYGYGFCVIDKMGTVLFHKDQQKNLTEDFVRECNNPSALRSRLATRINGFFDGSYQGAFQRFFYLPVTGTPYSVVTFKDKQITWEEDLDIISVCSILVLMNLGLMLLVFAHIRSTSYTNSRIKEKNFSFTWLRPHFRLKNDYIFISFFYGLSMIWQAGYLLCCQSNDNAGILESTFGYSYILLLLTHHRFTMTLSPGREKRMFPKRFFLLLVPYLLLTIVFALACSTDCLLPILVQAGHFLLYFTVTPVLLIFITRLNRTVSSGLDKRSKTLSYYWNIVSVNMTFRRTFTTFSYGLMLATSIVPVIIFYTLCYYEERKQSTAFTELEFAKKLPGDSLLLMQFAERAIPNTIHTPFYSEVFAKSISIVSDTAMIAEPSNRFSEFYQYIKPSFSKYSRQLAMLGGATGVAREFNWAHQANPNTSTLFYRFGKMMSDSAAAKNQAGIVGNKKFYNWKIEANNNPANLNINLFETSMLILMAAVLILLSAFYVLVSKLIRRIFFEGSADSSYLKEANRNVKDIFLIPGNLFVHAMPGSDRPPAEGSGRSIKFIDLSRDLPAEMDLSDLGASDSIVIAGMNPARATTPVTEKHIALLETILAEKRRVVLISNINSDRFNTAIRVQHPDLLNRWESIRKSFYHVNAVIADVSGDLLDAGTGSLELAQAITDNIDYAFAEAGHQPPLTDDEKLMISHASSELVEKLVSECRYTDYLPSCYPPLFDFSRRMAVSIFSDIGNVPRGSLNKIVENRLKFVFENTCLQLKEIAGNFYEELWTCLDLDEQRTLYDIAIDDLVNPANRKVAARLAELGMIHAEPFISCYRLFNSSFRSFVFDHVAKTEITAFRAEIKQQGRTGNILLPMGIIIVACIIFIFSTQKDAFLDLITYLGAAAAGITGILKLISIIPNSKSSG